MFLEDVLEFSPDLVGGVSIGVLSNDGYVLLIIIIIIIIIIINIIIIIIMFCSC